MMPLCVVLDGGNNLVAKGEYNGECTGYVLMTAAEYSGVKTNGELWSFPEPAVFAAVFSGTLAMVLFFTYISTLVGEVAGFFGSTTQTEEL